MAVEVSDFVARTPPNLPKANLILSEAKDLKENSKSSKILGG
jgi:hypothetical protein